MSKYDTSGNPEDRYWSRVDKGVGHGPSRDCHLWIGSVDNKGYGKMQVFGVRVKAHRYAWHLAGNVLPVWPMVIDHKCRVRNCVNPVHLRVLSQGENAVHGDGLPAQRKRMTHCVNGHLLSGDNLLEWYFKAHGRRRCKTCAYAATNRAHKASRAKLKGTRHERSTASSTAPPVNPAIAAVS